MLFGFGDGQGGRGIELETSRRFVVRLEYGVGIPQVLVAHFADYLGVVKLGTQVRR